MTRPLTEADSRASKIMTRRSIEFGVVLIIVCGLVIWTAFGRLPLGSFNNMGFGSDWDCPPNATPAATVCVKRAGPAN